MFTKKVVFRIFPQTYPSDMVGSFEICENMDNCLNQLNFNSKLAVAVSYEYVRRNRLFPTSNVYCFEKYEIIHSFAWKFLVSKNFSHLNQFNRFLQAASMNGLVKKWQSDNRNQPKNKQPDKMLGDLTLAHLHGTQIIWFFLKAAALTIFFLERFIYKKAIDRNSLRFWKVAEKIICPDGHLMVKNKSICQSFR